MNQRKDSVPESFTYITEGHVTDSVPKYLDNKFLSCCDCTDNCENKDKCPCWRLTLDGYRFQKNLIDNLSCCNFCEEEIENKGYEYKRLHYVVPTGIFECNVNCKCSQVKCLNRVVQNPIDHRLELFKTKECGWGVRTLTDIPKSAFVCCYLGEIIDEEKCKRQDDAYFASLSFIDTVEKFKEGYEKDVSAATEEINEPPAKRICFSSDNLETVNKTRNFFEDSVGDYLIDGKYRGNIGRFINVSIFFFQLFFDHLLNFDFGFRQYDSILVTRIYTPNTYSLRRMIYVFLAIHFLQGRK